MDREKDRIRRKKKTLLFFLLLVVVLLLLLQTWWRPKWTFITVYQTIFYMGLVCCESLFSFLFPFFVQPGEELRMKEASKHAGVNTTGLARKLLPCQQQPGGWTRTKEEEPPPPPPPPPSPSISFAPSLDRLPQKLVSLAGSAWRSISLAGTNPIEFYSVSSFYAPTYDWIRFLPFTPSPNQYMYIYTCLLKDDCKLKGKQYIWEWERKKSKKGRTNAIERLMTTKRTIYYHCSQ